MSKPSTTTNDSQISYMPHWSGERSCERRLYRSVIASPLTVQPTASSEVYPESATDGRTNELFRRAAAEEIGGERFTLLQKWDGVVLIVSSGTFTARLFDSAGNFPSQQAVFENTELSPEEQNQIEVGASFVWTIGFRHVGPTRRRDSVIYFRRLPTWDAEEIEKGKKLGHQLSEQIGWK